MTTKLKDFLKFILFASVGFLILFFIYRSQSNKYLAQCIAEGNQAEECNLLFKILNDFATVNWAWLILILIIYTLSNVFRTWRWQMLLEPLGHKASFKNAFMAIMIGYFTNLGFPRLGEVMRAGMFAKYDGVSVEKALGTIVTDRIVDVISLFVFLLIAAPFAYGPVMQYMHDNPFLNKLLSSINWTIIILGLLAIMVAGYILFKNQFIRNTAIFKKATTMFIGFKDGILSIFSLRNPGLFIFHSVAIWICYYLMTYLTFNAYEPTAHLGPKEGLVTFIFGTIGMLFPSPGGMGSYHLMVMEALSFYNVDSVSSFSFANIIYFSIQIFSNVLLGGLSLVFMSILNRNK